MVYITVQVSNVRQADLQAETFLLINIFPLFASMYHKFLIDLFKTPLDMYFFFNHLASSMLFFLTLFLRSHMLQLASEVCQFELILSIDGQ